MHRFRIFATYAAHLSVLNLITRMVFGQSTQHKAPCCVVFSTPLSPRPSWAQISSSILENPQPAFVLQCERPTFLLGPLDTENDVTRSSETSGAVFPPTDLTSMKT